MSVAGPRAMRDSLPQIAVAMVIAVFVLLHAWEDAQKSFGTEYYQRWVIGQEIDAGNARQIYSPQFGRDIGQKYWIISHSDRATDHQLVASDARRTLRIDAMPLGLLHDRSALLIKLRPIAAALSHSPIHFWHRRHRVDLPAAGLFRGRRRFLRSPCSGDGDTHIKPISSLPMLANFSC